MKDFSLIRRKEVFFKFDQFYLGEDILVSMLTLDFDSYVEPLRTFLTKIRDVSKYDRTMTMGGDLPDDLRQQVAQAQTNQLPAPTSTTSSSSSLSSIGQAQVATKIQVQSQPTPTTVTINNQSISDRPSTKKGKSKWTRTVWIFGKNLTFFFLNLLTR